MFLTKQTDRHAPVSTNIQTYKQLSDGKLLPSEGLFRNLLTNAKVKKFHQNTSDIVKFYTYYIIFFDILLTKRSKFNSIIQFILI